MPILGSALNLRHAALHSQRLSKQVVKKMQRFCHRFAVVDRLSSQCVGNGLFPIERRTGLDEFVATCTESLRKCLSCCCISLSQFRQRWNGDPLPQRPGSTDLTCSTLELTVRNTK